MDNLTEAVRLCTEIGLQTYGRKPHEMTATAEWQKLQMAEKLARQIRSLVSTEIQRREDVESRRRGKSGV